MRAKRFIVIGLVTVAWALACGTPSKPAAVPAPPVSASEPPAMPAVAPLPPRDPMNEPTPLDPQIKIGKLSNGLTYYVMKHKKPEQRAALWLAVDAGSVLEDEDQKGLAHFVEHMAFNGTKKYPKQAIIDYIEKVGMDFGADLNAYTFFDETVYQLTVPTDDKTVMLTGLDILREWASEVSFDPIEVDKERGVVLEEWRLGRGAFARIDDKQWPIIYKGSQYGVRLPIGDPDILKTAKRDTLYRFYKDWYRPDVMAVFAVGDFDPIAMEKEIKDRFGSLVNPAKERPRTKFPVPRDHEMLITSATDPEMPVTQVEVSDKMDRRPELTKADYRRFIVEGLYHSMLGARFQELGEDPAAPFLYAGSSTGGYARTAEMFTRSAQAKEGKTLETIAVLMREIARVEKHGFVATELERARKATLANAENSAAEWDKTPNDQIVDEMTRNFLEHEQMPGRHVELAFNREFLPQITLDELNHLARTWGSGEKGRVIALSGPAKSKLPSDDEIRKAMQTAVADKIEPWKDEGADRPLVANKPAPGKVTSTTTDDATGSTTWMLANGVKVVYKVTNFQNDEINFSGWQLGGSSLVPDKDYNNARYAGGIVSASGVGDHDRTALRKVLAGKVASAWVGIGELSQTVSGSARPADLETALQLVYLRMTAPRRDERAFANWKQDQLDWVRNRTLMPEVMFFDEMNAVESGNHLRRKPATVKTIESIDLDKALAIYKERFADANGYTFIFIGNIDPGKLQPLVETYLGGLPSKGRKEKWKDIGIKYPTTKITKEIKAGSEPKSFVSISMGAPEKWTKDGERDAEILSMVLDIRMREVLREDMGGVYGVSIWAGLSREPTQRRSLEVFFGCNPDNVEKLKKATFDELEKIGKEGIGPLYLEKVSEKVRRAHEVNLKENSWWSGQMREALYYNEDFKVSNDVDALIKRVTSDNVKASIKRFFDPKKAVFGVMRPKSVAKAAVATPGDKKP